MKKAVFILAILFSAAAAYSQRAGKSASGFNLGFEKTENGLPAGWKTIGSKDYKFTLDSSAAFSGKYAACIEYTGNQPDFGAWSFAIPGSYTGKKVSITGYIRTENVTEGYAGFWMRIEPDIATGSLGKSGGTGTTGWKKYEITVVADPETPGQLLLGVMLTGKGKMWIDDISISIDGRKIEKVKPLGQIHFAARDDHEFDEGSKIQSIALDCGQVNNLQTLGLMWGYLKYYHPAVASGKLNWDYELFRILPAIISSKNQQARDSIYVKWIKKLGPFKQQKTSTTDLSTIKTDPDLGWIIASGFSEELTTLLLKIRTAERPAEHYYVGLYKGVGNPKFENENPYKTMKYPDAGFRLLAVFRYWNIIRYYFPYRNLIGEDWNSVLKEFIPKVAGAADEKEYALGMLELIVRIRDTHAKLGGSARLFNMYGDHFSAVRVKFVENKLVVTGFYDDKAGKESGLEKGDIVTHINNRPVDEILGERLKYIPGSNYAAQLRDAAPTFLNTNDSVLPVRFVREHVTETRILKMYNAGTFRAFNKTTVPDTSFRFVSKDIACIDNGLLKRKDLPTIWKEIQHTKGLIIDIRNYPSDFPIYALSYYLMPARVPFVKFTNGSIQTPGQFTFTGPLQTGKTNSKYYKGKVILIVNETTQSSAEFHTMAYRVHPNATVIGSTTSGADGNISRFTLPGGLTTVFSGIGVYYPDGKETQRVGIVPDIYITPTISGIKNGKDELLEKAISIIESR